MYLQAAWITFLTLNTFATVYNITDLTACENSNMKCTNTAVTLYIVTLACISKQSLSANYSATFKILHRSGNPTSDFPHFNAIRKSSSRSLPKSNLNAHPFSNNVMNTVGNKCVKKPATHTGRSGFSSSFGFNEVAATAFFSSSLDVGL